MTWLRWASDELHAKWIHVIPNARLLRTLSAYTARHLPLPDAPPGAEGRDGGRGVQVRAAHGPTPTATLATPCGPAPGRDAAPVRSRDSSHCVRTLRRRTRAVGDGRAKTGAAVGVGPPCVAVLSRARALLVHFSVHFRGICILSRRGSIMSYKLHYPLVQACSHLPCTPRPLPHTHTTRAL